MRKVIMKEVHILILFITALLLSTTLSAIAGTSPSLLILSPSTGQEFKEGDSVVIAISIKDAEGDVDESTFSLYLDGKNITQNANISVFLVTYTIEKVQGIGKHSFSFEAADREGNKSEVSGYFYVAKKRIEKEFFSVNGSVRMGGRYDKEADEELVGVASVNLYGNIIETFSYSLNVELTNETTTDQQRVSTYRLDIESPIGTFIFGDTTPSFTDYSINGTQVFGIHLMPQFGPVGFELVYGQSYRAVKDLEIYKRMVYGGKLKIGNSDTVFWGLSVLKAKDDVSSLSSATNTTPKDNLVVSTDFSLKLFRGIFGLRVEANESLLNEDITSGASDFSDFKLPINPQDYEWLFTINEHIVPIMPGFTNLAAKGVITAGPVFGNTINFEYFYVGPSYYSLLNSGLTNDQSGFKIYDTQWLFNRMVYLNASYQNSWNNLENTLSNTTRSQGYSLGMSAFPNDYLTLNGGFSYSTSSNKADVDTSTLMLNVGATKNMVIGSTDSYLSLSTSANIYRDKVSSGNDSERYSIRSGLTSYFDRLPLSTKGVLGYDFGSQGSLYLEGWAEYAFLPDQSLVVSAGAVYQSGPGSLDISSDLSWNAIYDIDVEASLDYITDSGDISLSVYATKKF